MSLEEKVNEVLVDYGDARRTRAYQFDGGNISQKEYFKHIISDNELAKSKLLALIKEETVKARIAENEMYKNEIDRHYHPSSPNDPHIPLKQFDERIAQLQAELKENK